MAFELDLRPVRGDTFSKTIRIKDKHTGQPLDLTGWDWVSQARKDADDADVIGHHHGGHLSGQRASSPS